MPEKNRRFSIYSDEELMFYLGNGEVLAFDELYGRYSKRLMGYFVRMLNYDKELAADALQDLFLKIAEAPEKFNRTRSFKTWIFSIASNSCKNYYRHQQVKSKNKEEIGYWLDSAHGGGTDLYEQLDAREFKRILEEVLNELAHEKKEAFILKYQEDKTIAEIALIQNCPEGSVKSRLHYTIKILEEKLKIFNPAFT